MLHLLWPILDLHPSQLQLRNKTDFLLTCSFAVVSNKTNWTIAIVIYITAIVMIGIVTYTAILASKNAESVTSVEFWQLACGKIVKICYNCYKRQLLCIFVTQHKLMRLFEGDIKTDILTSTYCSKSKEHFWHPNDFHIIFPSKVTDNLISNCLITLKINYQDMGRQSNWFVHKLIEDIKNNWIKT